MDIQDIINRSSFEIQKGLFYMAKVNDFTDANRCFLVTSDEIEKTVICSHEIELNNIIEKKPDYVLIGIEVSLPFDAIGFLSKITTCLADSNIPILVVSTYSRDYVLIPKTHLENARVALLKIGLKEK
jgi:hypothetical protein